MRSVSGKFRSLVRVGLTGGFGSGKSTVLKMFRKKGARVMDADEIVHGLFSHDSGVRNAIVRCFGRESVRRDGRVDRKYLAGRIFTSVAERRALERIIHPAVRRTIMRGMASLRSGVVVIDIPLLYESGLKNRFDRVVVVRASRERRIQRLAARGFSARDFQRRARAQWPLKKKERLADFVVNNNGTRAQTKKQIDEIWQCITNHVRVARGKNGHT